MSTLDKFNYDCEGQMSLFDFTHEEFKIDKPIRLIELFAGVGSQAMAIRDIGVEFEHWKISEWEISACASYKSIHTDDFNDYSKNIPNEELPKILFDIGISTNGKDEMTLEQIKNHQGGDKWRRKVYNNFKASKNIGSICKHSGKDLEIVDADKYCYIMTYSFPCQDLSVAGKQRGMTKGSGTRSGLLWEVERLLNEVEHLPQVLVMENVPQVHSQDNMPDFRKWIEFLERKGYSNWWQDLNAKDYGVAQNRERTFMVSILGEWYYKFPKPIPLTKTMKDYLEDDVDEKYYINNDKAQQLIEKLISEGTIPSRAEQSRAEQKGICNTLTSVKKDNLVMEKVCYIDEQNMNARNDVVGTLTTDGSSPKHNNRVLETVRIKQATKEGYIECKIGGVADLSYPESTTRRGRVQGNGDISPTITATETGVHKIESQYRIRKLTPKECWRLMDFQDGDFDKAEAVNSNTQLYKQAGNSIVRNVLVAIFGQMIPGKEDIYKEVIRHE